MTVPGRRETGKQRLSLSCSRRNFICTRDKRKDRLCKKGRDECCHFCPFSLSACLFLSSFFSFLLQSKIVSRHPYLSYNTLRPTIPRCFSSGPHTCPDYATTTLSLAIASVALLGATTRYCPETTKRYPKTRRANKSPNTHVSTSPGKASPVGASGANDHHDARVHTFRFPFDCERLFVRFISTSTTIALR